jgi:RNA polymerase sigma factor (sigma-70 family)
MSRSNRPHEMGEGAAIGDEMAERRPTPIPASPTDAPPALATLYERHWQELVRYVRFTFGAGPPEPEDVVQAAFTHFAALVQPELVGNPRAFLYRAARNFVIDQRRHGLVRARAAQRGYLQDTVETADEHDSERVLEGKDRLRILEETVRGLPPRLRDALILHRIEELSYVDVARRMGVSQTTAKRLVAEAILICHRAVSAATGEDQIP